MNIPVVAMYFHQKRHNETSVYFMSKCYIKCKELSIRYMSECNKSYAAIRVSPEIDESNIKQHLHGPRRAKHMHNKVVEVNY